MIYDFGDCCLRLSGMAENKAKAVLHTKLKQLLITRKRTENVIISNKDTASYSD